MGRIFTQDVEDVFHSDMPRYCVCLFFFFFCGVFLNDTSFTFVSKKKILKKQKKDVTDNQLHANLGMFGLNTCVLLLKKNIYIYI